MPGFGGFRHGSMRAVSCGYCPVSRRHVNGGTSPWRARLSVLGVMAGGVLVQLCAPGPGQRLPGTAQVQRACPAAEDRAPCSLPVMG